MYWVCTFFVTRKLEVIFHWLFGNPFMSNQYQADFLKWISDSVLSNFCSHANFAANLVHKGASINDVGRRGGRGVSQMPILLHSLCSKLAYGDW